MLCMRFRPAAYSRVIKSEIGDRNGNTVSAECAVSAVLCGMPVGKLLHGLYAACLCGLL